MAVGGSPSFRLLTIEEAVPYEDVLKHWGNARETWSVNVWKHRASAKHMGKFMVELMDALTSEAIAEMWPRDGDFAALRNACRRLGGIGKAAAPENEVQELLEALAKLEQVTLPPPPKKKQTGKALPSEPDILELGDDGPEGIDVGNAVSAYDVQRQCWCRAEAIDSRGNGINTPIEFKVHYVGWSKKWDEWLQVDSGRLRSAHPIEGPASHPGFSPNCAIRPGPASRAASSVGEAAKDEDLDGLSDEDDVEIDIDKDDEPSKTLAKATKPARDATKRARAVSCSSSATSNAAKKKPVASGGSSRAMALQQMQAAGGSLPPPLGTKAIDCGDVPGEEQLLVGDAVIALDVRQIWCEAKVIDRRFEDGESALRGVCSSATRKGPQCAARELT